MIKFACFEECRCFSSIASDTMISDLVYIFNSLCILCFASISSSARNQQIRGIKSGVGTIDRMQQRRRESMRGLLEDNFPVPWADVMGKGNKIWWLIPTSPKWGPDYPPRSWGFSIQRQRQPTALPLLPEYENVTRQLEPHNSVPEIL